MRLLQACIGLVMTVWETRAFIVAGMMLLLSFVMLIITGITAVERKECKQHLAECKQKIEVPYCEYPPPNRSYEER